MTSSAAWLLAASLLGALAACSESTPDPPGAQCPNDLPQSCPAEVPSYATDVKPAIAANCFPCHAPGGRAASARDFSKYEVLHAKRAEVLRAVFQCAMPPADATTRPTAEERATLLTWLKCDAPNN